MRIRASRPPLPPREFDPLVAMGKSKSNSSAWVDLQGNPAAPPDFSSLPTPDDVLSGRCQPDFSGLRLRSQDDFVCGYLHWKNSNSTIWFKGWWTSLKINSFNTYICISVKNNNKI